MKKIFLIFAMAISMNVVFGQTSTLRLEMPATPPAVGEDFLVGVWLDELDWPTDETIWSALFAWEYDDAVVTPVPSGVPFNRYFYNLDAMFGIYGVTPLGNYPAPPGDLRIFFATQQAYGLDPTFSTGVPMKLFDLKFTYHGGDIAINWGTTAKLDAVDGEAIGGKLSKAMTEMYAPPPPAAGVPYALNLIGYPVAAEGKVWTGAGDGTNWSDGTNWDPAGEPMATDDVVINDLPAKATAVVIAGPATCAALTVGTGAELSIEVNGSLTTNGAFTNDGDFVIDSDGAGLSGSYMNTFGETFDGAGTFTFNRDITTTADLGQMAGWHYLSSPVTTFSSHDIFDYYVNYWTEATGTFTHLEGDPTIPCDPGPDFPMNAGGAWSVKWDNDYLCAGTNPATGTVIPLSGAMADVNSTALNFGPLARTVASAYPGWWLIGNPYPCAIDFELVDLTSWGGVARIYNDNVGNYESWVTGAGFNLAPTQAFFIEAMSDGVFIDMSPGRTHDAAAQFKSDLSRLTLQATGTETDYSDKTHIRILANATTGVDTHLDATKWNSTVPAAPQLYTHAAGENMEWNSLPEVPASVSMSFEVGTAGTYTIQAIETGDFDFVLLEDVVTGVKTNLLEDSYTFDYVSETKPFIVHFAPLGVNDLNANSVKIWSLDNNIIVNVTTDVSGEIAVYNMMGQEVVRTEIEGTETQIPVSDVNTTYIVKVISETKAVTGKVYVK